MAHSRAAFKPIKKLPLVTFNMEDGKFGFISWLISVPFVQPNQKGHGKI